ncbi:MAG: sarcosine oxidase subunit delta [Hyphomonadaceae bacterium]|nr:sarcosine oxidase subunit delta [Hyphomonadaceae bacterium]
MIPCPHCGPRTEIEFVFGRALEAAHAHDDPAAMMRRANPAGWTAEVWRHIHGCGAWIVVERNTATHAVKGTRLPEVPAP